MAFNGGFAGGLADGLFKSWRLQEERRRTDLQAERDQRLNKIQDLQIAEAEKQALEAADLKKFETDAAEIMGKVGETDPYSVGGLKFGGDKGAAQQHAAQASQANLRRMDNAMEAFKAGTTPAMETPSLTDDKVLGTGKTYGRQQAFDDLTKKAGEYGNLGASKAQQVIRSQYAQRAFDVIQKAATMPDQEEALRIVVNTVDSIPDGRRVVGKQLDDGSVEVGYVDEATGALVGRMVRYKSPSDFMLRYASSLSPDGLTKYLEGNVKSSDQYALAMEKMQASVDRMERAQADKIELALLRNGLKGGGSGGGSRAGGGSGGSAATGDDFDPKFLTDTQKWIHEGLPESGEQFTTPEGEAVSASREQLASGAAREFDRIRRANPGISPEEARGIALDVVRVRMGGDPSAVTNRPAPQLQADGQWRMRVRTAEGNEVNYPTPPSDVAPAEVFAQESAWAQQLVDSGEATQLEQRLKDPKFRSSLERAFMSPEDRAKVPPAFLRKVEVLNAYAGVGGDLNAIDLASKRAAVADMRKSMRTKRKDGTGSAAPAWSPEELQRAQSLGVTPTTPLSTVIGDAAGAVSNAASGVANQADTNLVNNLAGMLRAGMPMRAGNAAALFDVLNRRPELRAQLSPEEISAIEVAVGRRLNTEPLR